MIQSVSINNTLKRISEIEGHVASAIVDHTSGMCLGTVGGGNGFDIGMAAAGNTEVVRAKLAVMKSLGLTGAIEDILITLNSQYHLIRPLRAEPSLFMYVALKRSGANLALARHQVSEIEREMLG